MYYLNVTVKGSDRTIRKAAREAWIRISPLMHWGTPARISLTGGQLVALNVSWLSLTDDVPNCVRAIEFSEERTVHFIY